MKLSLRTSNKPADNTQEALNKLRNVVDKATRYQVSAMSNENIESDLASVFAILSHLHLRENSEICEVGCGLLWNLSAEASLRAIMLSDYNVINVLVDIIRIHSSLSFDENITASNQHVSKWVVFMALGALSNTTVDETVESFRNFVLRVLEFRVTEIVLDLMRDKSCSEQVQEKGAWILWTLAHETEARQWLINETDCLRIINKAMACHIENQTVQEQICGLLWNLSDEITLRSKLNEYHILAKVTNIMDIFPDNHLIQKHGCCVMANMMSLDSSFISSNLTYLKILTRAMKKFGGLDTIIAKKSISALLSLVTAATAEPADIYRALFNANAIESVVQLLSKYLDNTVILYRGICFLLVVIQQATSVSDTYMNTISYSLARTLGSIDGMRVLVQIAQRHTENEQITILVQEILEHFECKAMTSDEQLFSSPAARLVRCKGAMLPRPVRH